MQTIIRPQAGDIGLTDITGPVGWGIWLGQAATGDFSWKEHALVVTGDFGECIEAVPPRARRGSIGRYDPRTVVYLRVPMTDPERYAVAHHDGRAPGDVTPGDLWRLGHHKGWVLAA